MSSTSFETLSSRKSHWTPFPRAPASRRACAASGLVFSTLCSSFCRASSFCLFSSAYADALKTAASNNIAAIITIGISNATFYNWKAKYGGLEVREVKRLKELEAENAKLKRMFAETSMENYALKDLIEKKL